MQFSRNRSAFTSLGLLLVASTAALAAPVNSMQVNQAVQTWLQRTPAPLRTPLGADIATIETHRDVDGQILFHEVRLAPEGFVIVAPDDLLEPIVAFSAHGVLKTDAESHLYLLLQRDLRTRLARIAPTLNGKAPHLSQTSTRATQAKWEALAGNANTVSLNTVNDVRVAPLVASKWSQSTVNDSSNGLIAYNYWTPSHYVCGCVATAMAQLMRFHSFPSTGIGVNTFTVKVKTGTTTVTKTLSTRGGDGLGGAYDWSLMSFTLNSSTPDAQRGMVGSLCYDAGLSVKMSYASDGSGAYSADVSGALKNTFKYTNAIYGSNGGSLSGSGLTEMVQPNLDAGYPVIFGISSADGDGHEIVCDGYGYASSTLYHHLNMGWSGSDDAWYNLPDIETSQGTYNVIDDCIYNVFKIGTGEILSGRVTDGSGSPVAGVAVASGAVNSTTNTNGIYALKGLKAGPQTLTATKTGLSFPTAVRVMGTSSEGGSVGNIWGVDLVQGTGATPTIFPQPLTQDVKLGGSVTFVAGATGVGPLSFQWTKNGTSVGADNPTYTLDNAADTDDQAQVVLHTNGGSGSADSTPATLNVVRLFNGDFEKGNIGWTLINPGDNSGPNANVILGPSSYAEVTPHGSSWLCIGDWSASCTDYASQEIVLPNASAIDLSFWVGIANKTKTPSSAANIFTVKILDTNDNLLTTLKTLDNTNAEVDANTKVVWKSYSADLKAYAGKTVKLRIESYQPGGSDTGTIFAVDDVALTITKGPKATLSQGPLTLITGGQASFTATVSGAASDNSVNWTTTPVGGSFNPAQTAGDGAAATLFTAGPSVGTYTVTATPVEANGTAASTAVTLVDPSTVKVTLTPSATAVKLGQDVSLTASVTPLTDTSVDWSCSPGGQGTFASTSATAASWSSNTAGTFNLTATSHGAPTRSDIKQIRVVDTSAIALVLDPAAATLLSGTSATFTASGDLGLGVNWTLTTPASKTDNGLSTLVTVPTAAPLKTVTYTLTATHKLDASKFAMATLTVKGMDLIVDGVLDPLDLLGFAAEWGKDTSSAANFKGSGTVDETDLSAPPEPAQVGLEKL